MNQERDALISQTLSLINEAVDVCSYTAKLDDCTAISSSGNHSSSSRDQSKTTILSSISIPLNIYLNGRISDSILRCYLDQPDLARVVWKKQLLPLALKMEKGNEIHNGNQVLSSFLYMCSYLGLPFVRR